MNPWTWEIGPGYFATLGVPVVAGRDFSERDADGAPPVAIVNETFARYFFGADNPIGRRFGFSAQNDAGRMEIVGVVKDTVYSQVRPGEAGGDATGSLRVANTGVPRVVYTPYQQSGRAGRDDLLPAVHGGGGASAAGPGARGGAARRSRSAGVRDDDAGHDRGRVTGGRTHARAAVGAVRRAGDDAGGGRPVRPDELLGGAAHARDRHPHRARCGAAGRARPGAPRRGAARPPSASPSACPGAYAIGRAARVAACSASRRSIRRRWPWPPACWPRSVSRAGYLPARRAAATQPLLALRTE